MEIFLFLVHALVLLLTHVHTVLAFIGVFHKCEPGLKNKPFLTSLKQAEQVPKATKSMKSVTQIVQLSFPTFPLTLSKIATTTNVGNMSVAQKNGGKIRCAPTQMASSIEEVLFKTII